MFSYAVTVTDKIEGWEEEGTWVGSRIAACMWIYTKAVLCYGQESTQEYLRRRLLSIMESVNWVCEEAMEDHEWVSELAFSLQENEVFMALNWRIDVPCMVQWRLLWFSPPTRLDQRFDVFNMTNEATFTLPFGGSHTPRTCLLRSVGAVLYRSPDKDWDVEREMKGWGLGDGLCSRCVMMTVETIFGINEGANNP